jgi:hypothetical protein
MPPSADIVVPQVLVLVVLPIVNHPMSLATLVAMEYITTFKVKLFCDIIKIKKGVKLLKAHGKDIKKKMELLL